jgi:hypothetical protein
VSGKHILYAQIILAKLVCFNTDVVVAGQRRVEVVVNLIKGDVGPCGGVVRHPFMTVFHCSGGIDALFLSTHENENENENKKEKGREKVKFVRFGLV